MAYRRWPPCENDGGDWGIFWWNDAFGVLKPWWISWQRWLVSVCVDFHRHNNQYCIYSRKASLDWPDVSLNTRGSYDELRPSRCRSCFRCDIHSFVFALESRRTLVSQSSSSTSMARESLYVLLGCSFFGNYLLLQTCTSKCDDNDDSNSSVNDLFQNHNICWRILVRQVRDEMWYGCAFELPHQQTGQLMVLHCSVLIVTQSFSYKMVQGILSNKIGFTM